MRASSSDVGGARTDDGRSPLLQGHDLERPSTVKTVNEAEKSQDATPAGKPERWRNLIAFWLFGLINNALYVVMIAGANEINSAGVALVYLAAAGPGVIVSTTFPFWYHLLSYPTKVCICALLMVGSLSTVAFGDSVPLKLVGVAMASAQQGLGEPSFLALSSYYSSSKCLTAWASGTGFAGIFGYVWKIVFDKGFEADFRVTLMVAQWLPVAMVCTFFYLLAAPENAAGDRQLAPETELRKRTTRDSGSPVDGMGFCQRGAEVLRLWPYLVPLVVVYVAEYTIQSGAWTVIGFPVTDKDSRQDFYTYSNLCYQIGVFISRSSGTVFKANRLVLWIMPFLQTGFLAFYLADGMLQFAGPAPGGWWLLAPALCTGLLGGAVYINCFTLIARELDPAYHEFALAACALGAQVGTLLANVISVFVQGCLLGYNDVVDADKPDFTCGYDIWS